MEKRFDLKPRPEWVGIAPEPKPFTEHMYASDELLAVMRQRQKAILARDYETLDRLRPEWDRLRAEPYWLEFLRRQKEDEIRFNAMIVANQNARRAKRAKRANYV